MPISDLERITAFEHRFAQAQTTQFVDFAWGFGLLHADFGYSQNHNRVVVTSAAPATPAADILASTDALLGDAGLTHRYVSFDSDLLGTTVAPDLVAAGYDHVALTTMIYAGRRPETGSHAAQPVSFDTLRPALIRDWQLDLADASVDDIGQLADRTALYSSAAEVTHLAAFEGEEIAARIDLYVDAAMKVAQIENLVTHPAFRGRGHARAVVSEALHRGWVDDGVLFLVADADDWPHEWYTRLGFEHARRTHHFSRTS